MHVDVDLILLILSTATHLQADSRLGHVSGLIHLGKKRVSEFEFLNRFFIKLLKGVPG